MCLMNQAMDELTQEAATYIGAVKEAATAYKINTSTLEQPVHNPVQKRLSKHCFGKEYFVSSVKQELQTSLHRALNMKKSARFKPQKKWGHILDFAASFKKLFVNNTVHIGDVQESLAVKLGEVYAKYVEKGSIVHMDTKVQPVSWHIKEHLKQINKIKSDKSARQAYKAKAGQSVKAWERDFNGAFCHFFRLMEERLISSLKPNIIYANGKSDDELKNLIDKYYGLWEFVFNLDLTEFDGSQNACTMEIEKHLWKFMLGCEMTLDNFYMLRTQMKVFGTGYSYTKKYLKDSGAPETLPSNTLLLMALTSMLFNADDIIFALFKGDDAAVALRPFASTTYNFAKLNSISNFQPKFTTTRRWFEFCGNIYYDKSWFYDFIKLGRKVLNRPFASRTDFEDYQNSIIDKLRAYIGDESKVVNILSIIYDCPTGYVESIIEQLGAFAFCKWEHIDPQLQEVEFTDAQFASIPRKVTSKEAYSRSSNTLWETMQRRATMNDLASAA